jgi:hypothetical protein
VQGFLLILAVTLVTPHVTFMNVNEKHHQRSENDEDAAETVSGGATHVCVDVFFTNSKRINYYFKRMGNSP